jgi:hypothetical protein
MKIIEHTYIFGVKYQHVLESNDIFICSFTGYSVAYSVMHVISMCTIT